MPPPINKKDGEPLALESVAIVGATWGAIGPVTDVEVAVGLFAFGAAVVPGADVPPTDDAVVTVGCAALEVASAVGAGVLVELGAVVGKIGAGVNVAPTAGGGGTGVLVDSLGGLGVLTGSFGVLVGFPPTGVRVGTV